MFLRTSWPQKMLATIVTLLLLLAGVWLTPKFVHSQADPTAVAPADQRLQALQQQIGPALVTTYRTTEGQQGRPTLRFLGASKAQPISVMLNGAAIDTTAAQPEQVARAFLQQYGDLFGVQQEASDLRTTRTWSVTDETVGARNFARFQQLYQGLPVIGGDFTVQSTAKGVLSASGRLLTAQQLNGLANVVPQLNGDQARQIALTAVVNTYKGDAAKLTVRTPVLSIYNPTVFLSGMDVTRLVWQMAVTDNIVGGINEFVLVDAQRGGIVLHFNQSETVRNRIVYDNQNNPGYGLPGNGPVRQEGGAATGITDVDGAYDYAGN